MNLAVARSMFQRYDRKATMPNRLPCVISGKILLTAYRDQKLMLPELYVTISRSIIGKIGKN